MPEPWFPSPLALTPPKEKTGKAELTAPLPTFALEPSGITRVQMKLGLDKTNTSLENLQELYNGMNAGERTKESGALKIKYSPNPNITRSPSEVLKTRKGDCDEITRFAFLVASQFGIQNTVMVEMTWTNPKTKQFEGHSAIVLIPENPLDAPLVFDFTYLRNGAPLDSANLEASLKKLYAEDAKNPGFKITQFGTVAEVEASYYDKIGWQYSTAGNWEMTALAYEKAVSLVPDSFEYNRDLAFADKKLGKYEKALEQYKRTLGTTERKGNAEVLANVGELCLVLKRYGEAIDSLKTALSSSSDEQLDRKIKYDLASAYVEKGRIAKNEGKLESALNFFNEALVYEPGNHKILNAIKQLERDTK